MEALPTVWESPPIPIGNNDTHEVDVSEQHLNRDHYIGQPNMIHAMGVRVFDSLFGTCFYIDMSQLLVTVRGLLSSSKYRAL